MISTDRVLLVLGSFALLSGTASLAFDLATRPPLPRPTLGNRGLKRDLALSAGGAFPLFEPMIRYLAARLVASWPRSLRPRVARVLQQSGDHLGLSEDELAAASAMSAIAGAALALLASACFGISWALSPVAFIVGALAPWFRIRAIAAGRTKLVTRSLPGVIELAAMCMGAGLDFPSALRRIVESAATPREPIVEEILRVLQELDLGCTRRSAMNGLAARVPSPEVRELVNSVLQAEDKGNPLARVLTIQAHTLRLRRSVAAEEAASEAALMLVGPMALIFICVIVLLLAPVAVRVMTGGFTQP